MAEPRKPPRPRTRTELRKLIRLLKAAAEIDAPVRIIYHGGRQPGSVRSIRPMEIDEETCYAEDLTDGGTDKTFRLDRLELAPHETTAPSYNPDANDSDDGLRWLMCSVVGEAGTNPDGQRRQELIRAHARAGQLIVLRRDPRPDEAEAIAVHLESGEHVGDLSGEHSWGIAERIDAGARYQAVLHSVTGGVPGKEFVGLVVRVAEVVSPRETPANAATTFTVTVAMPSIAPSQGQASLAKPPGLPPSRFKTRAEYLAWKAQRGNDDAVVQPEPTGLISRVISIFRARPGPETGGDGHA